MSDTADQMRDFLGHAVNARRHLGKSEAVFQVARELDLPPRRIVGIMRGEYRRVWADEFQRAQAWYRDLCDRQAAQLEHEAVMLRARRDELARRLSCDSSE